MIYSLTPLCLLRSKREPQDIEEQEGTAAVVSGRDVFNEKPTLEDIMTAEGAVGLRCT